MYKCTNVATGIVYTYHRLTLIVQALLVYMCKLMSRLCVACSYNAKCCLSSTDIFSYSLLAINYLFSTAMVVCRIIVYILT